MAIPVTVISGPTGRPAWLRAAALALACGLPGACGGGAPSVPSSPGSAPSAQPVVGGFLHVLQHESVLTYRIDAGTGRLQRSATQSVANAHTLSGEPLGRYVFAAYGPRSGTPFAPSIVAYAPDPVNGSLVAVSEASSDPIWCPSCASWGRSQAWYWLSASATRVFAMWSTVTYHDVYNTSVTHAVSSGGQLGPAQQLDFDERDPESVALDVDAGVFYKGTYTGGLTAHAVEPDGRLSQMGASHLCLAEKLSYASPFVAVQGFVFASGYIAPPMPYEKTVCSWEGPGLAPRADLGMQFQRGVAVVPRGPGSSAQGRPTTLVAMVAELSTPPQHELRLFGMGDDGRLELLETIASPGTLRDVRFHPSGRFLYTSRASSHSAPSASLTVYSIDAQGRLEIVETLEDAGGTIAVTLR